VFLRDALYNHYLRGRYGLAEAEAFLEIPLDGRVVTELKRRAGRGKLKGWLSIRRLTPAVSHPFQVFAQELAAREGMARVHLDVLFWTPDTSPSGPHKT
jgi:hypothetical protein